MGEKALDAIRESGIRFRALADASPVGIFLSDPSGANVYTNRALQRLSGLSFEDSLGASWVRAIHPEDREAALAAYTGAAARRETVDVTHRYIQPDGSAVWVHVKAAPVIEGELYMGYVGIVEDISERRRAEEALRDSERRLRMIVDAEPECVHVGDADSTVLEMNAAGLAMIGAESLEQVRGHALLDLVAPRDREAFAAVTARAADGHPGSLRFEIIGLKGARRWLETHVVPFRDARAAGKPVLGITRDITEQKKAEAALRESETMSSLGALLAGVVHEVRNPLFALSATLDAFEARFARETGHERFFSSLRQQVDRVSALMRDLLEYGKPRPMELVKGDLADVVAQAVSACTVLARQAGVRVEVRVPSDLPALLMEPARLVHVFRNVIDNAIRHSPRGGRVNVAARLVSEEGGSFVECTACDSGPGFDEDDLPHVFEPFFTRRRGGTGLGLSIVQRIVADHHGVVVAANRPEGGAEVRVRLPA